MRHAIFIALISTLVTLSASGCAKLMGNLRQDLDDSEGYSFAPSEPVTGGRWAERGFLNEPERTDERYKSVGHSERGPASVGAGPSEPQDNWSQQSTMAESVEPSPQEVQPVIRPYKNGSRATRADFVDEAPNEGSLWASDGQTNYYFTKNKVRGVGDIISITVDEGLVIDLALEVKRTLTQRERDIELAIAQEKIRKRAAGAEEPAKDAVASAASAPQRTPAVEKPSPELIKVDDAKLPVATLQDVDLTSALSLKAGDTMLGEIVERFPNGNYKIRGTKRILYKNGSQRLVSLVGVVKGTDINEEDVVNSGKLYEYRLEAIR